MPTRQRAGRPRYIRPRYMGGIPASTFMSRTHFQAQRVQITIRELSADQRLRRLLCGKAPKL